MDGETLTIVRRAGYTINHIRPCTMEKGKKMAKVRLANPPKDIFSRLEKEGFDELKLNALDGLSPQLGQNFQLLSISRPQFWHFIHTIILFWLIKFFHRGPNGTPQSLDL